MISNLCYLKTLLLCFFFMTTYFCGLKVVYTIPKKPTIVKQVPCKILHYLKVSIQSSLTYNTAES